MKDPFWQIIAKESRTHFAACFGAYLVLWISRYLALRSAPSDAILLWASVPAVLVDFLTAVLMLTFFRVLYGFPLWFVRPRLRKIGTYVFFTLVFAVIFTLRTNQAIGVKFEPAGATIYFPYPSSPRFLPLRELQPAELRHTGAVQSLELIDNKITFAPAFNFDHPALANLHRIDQSLKELRAEAAD